MDNGDRFMSPSKIQEAPRVKVAGTSPSWAKKELESGSEVRPSPFSPSTLLILQPGSILQKSRGHDFRLPRYSSFPLNHLCT